MVTGKPKETAEVLRDGFLVTGDIGVMDEDGRLRLKEEIQI